MLLLFANYFINVDVYGLHVWIIKRHVNLNTLENVIGETMEVSSIHTELSILRADNAKWLIY